MKFRSLLLLIRKFVSILTKYIKFTFLGDSAGGNLLLATTLKCIHMSLRLPDGIFLAYVPVLVSFVPSPSRLLCLMDPLLPFGFMIRCLKGKYYLFELKFYFCFIIIIIFELNTAGFIIIPQKV